MLSALALRQKLESVASQINAPRDLIPSINEPSENAKPYVKLTTSGFRYCVQDRDSIIKDMETADVEELVYWVFADITFVMALAHELQFRRAGQDSRRLIFTHQLQLLEKLEPRWRTRRDLEIQAILSQARFNDVPED